MGGSVNAPCYARDRCGGHSAWSRAVCSYREPATSQSHHASRLMFHPRLFRIPIFNSVSGVKSRVSAAARVTVATADGGVTTWWSYNMHKAMMNDRQWYHQPTGNNNTSTQRWWWGQGTHKAMMNDRQSPVNDNRTYDARSVRGRPLQWPTSVRATQSPSSVPRL